jgi:hypothetical protein
MITFDMPSRDVCTMRRIPTNTPLQALVTLNDEAYVECAAGLADRMIAEGGAIVRGSSSQVVRKSRDSVVRGSPDPAQPPVRGQETLAQQETRAQQRIAWAYRAATGKEPATDTIDDLMRLYEKARDQHVGESPRDSSALRGETGPRAQQSGPTREQAALAIVASTILNLDEVLTK